MNSPRAGIKMVATVKGGPSGNRQEEGGQGRNSPLQSTCCVPDTVMILSSQELSLGEPVISKYQGL